MRKNKAIPRIGEPDFSASHLRGANLREAEVREATALGGAALRYVQKINGQVVSRLVVDHRAGTARFFDRSGRETARCGAGDGRVTSYVTLDAEPQRGRREDRRLGRQRRK